MNAKKDFTVAVVGGGFVGLVCAIELARKGVQVEIFEASAAYGDIGAGIGIGPNAYRVFESMGLVDDIKAVLEDQGPPLPLMTFVKGEDVNNVIYQYPSHNRTDQGFGVHRALFIKAIAQLLPTNVRKHFNKRCTSVTTTSDGRARVQFADGSEHTADLVVGADGIKSAVRAQVFDEKDVHLVDTLCVAYRTLIPMQHLRDAGVNKDLLKPHSRCWMGNDKHIIMYPVASGTMMNFAAFTTDHTRPMVPAGPQSSWSTWVTQASRDDVSAAFDDFGKDALKIIGCVDTPNKWAVHGIYPPLESYIGRAGDKAGNGKAAREMNVVLVGDAAHAMLPHLGAGAGAGIEDAFVLARLLAHPQTKRENISDVLRAYDVVRVPRDAYIANASERAGKAYQGRLHGMSDAERRKGVELQWEEIWEHDARTDVERAVEALVERGVFVREKMMARL